MLEPTTLSSGAVSGAFTAGEIAPTTMYLPDKSSVFWGSFGGLKFSGKYNIM